MFVQRNMQAPIVSFYKDRNYDIIKLNDAQHLEQRENKTKRNNKIVDSTTYDREGLLIRQWDQSKRQCIVIGNSPGSATEGKDDKTTSKLKNKLNTCGYGGYILLNLTDEIDILKSFFHEYIDIHGHKETKDLHILLMFGKFKSDTKSIIYELLNFCKQIKCMVLCFGLNKDGSPVIPLYVP